MTIHEAEALTHADKSQASPVSRALRVEADSGVCNAQQHVFILVYQFNAASIRFAVLGDILQPFLNDAKKTK